MRWRDSGVASSRRVILGSMFSCCWTASASGFFDPPLNADAPRIAAGIRKPGLVSIERAPLLALAVGTAPGNAPSGITGPNLPTDAGSPGIKGSILLGGRTSLIPTPPADPAPVRLSYQPEKPPSPVPATALPVAPRAADPTVPRPPVRPPIRAPLPPPVRPPTPAPMRALPTMLAPVAPSMLPVARLPMPKVPSKDAPRGAPTPVAISAADAIAATGANQRCL